MIRIKKWLLNNIDIKIIALIMAIILWFYITNEENIMAERYYEIEVRAINLDQSLCIKDIRNNVSIGIKGPEKTLDNISSQKIVGTVNLENIKEAGEYQLDVNVIVPKKTEIKKIIPNSLPIVIENIIKKKYDIGYNLIGLPKKGYSLKSEPKIEPNKVNIIGPESLLEKIDQVKVDIDINAIDSDFSKVEAITLLNRDDKMIENLKLEPEQALVTIEVEKGYPEKILPIKPRIIGKPANGYYISQIVAQPNYLKVYGNYSKIADLDFLETIPIDVSGVSKGLTVKVEPVLSQGVYLNEDERVVEVEIKVYEEREERIFEDIEIMPRNSSPFLSYQINPKTIKIVIAGEYSKIKNIKKEDINAFIDLENANQKVDTIKVNVQLPPYLQIVKIDPESVIISIENNLKNNSKTN